MMTMAYRFFSILYRLCSRCRLFFIIVAALFMLPQVALADPYCSVVSGNNYTLNYGNLVAGRDAASTMTFTVGCTFDGHGNPADTMAYVCVDMPADNPSSKIRTLTHGNQSITHELYKDANHTQIWGAWSSDNPTYKAYGGVQVYLTGPITAGATDANSTFSTRTTFTVYGKISADQTLKDPGVYSQSFTTSATAPVIYYSKNTPCTDPRKNWNGAASKGKDKDGGPGPAGGPGGGGPGETGWALPKNNGGTFTFTATIASTCSIFINTTDIKNPNNNANISLNTTLNPDNTISKIDTMVPIYALCTNTTPYLIGVSSPNYTGSGLNILYALKNDKSSVPYGIYTDAAYKNIWVDVKDTINCKSTSPHCISGTGTGAMSAAIPLYLRIFASPASAGKYTDTVTVTLQY